MSRASKITKARKLRAQGLTYREIGERLGMTLSTIKRWLNPTYAASQRAANRRSFRKHQEARAEGNRRWRLSNPEAVKRHRRTHREKHAGRVARGEREHQDRYREANRLKIVAQQEVRKAVRRGELERPDNCEVCGTGGRLHAHHHDYDKPLEVEWLCPPCHIERHHKPRFPEQVAA